MMKRLCCAFLSVSLAISMCFPVFSASSEIAENDSVSSTYTISDTVTLECEDFENGDVLISEFHSGELVHSVFINRDESTKTDTYFENGEIINQNTTTFTPLEWCSEPSVYASWFPVGQIKYNYYSYSGTLQGTHTASFKYISQYDATATYDLYGEYNSLASFVGLLTTLYSFTGAVASKVAAWFLSVLGISTGVAPFIIPRNSILTAEQSDLTWRATDTSNSDLYITVSGTK